MRKSYRVAAAMLVGLLATAPSAACTSGGPEPPPDRVQLAWWTSDFWGFGGMDHAARIDFWRKVANDFTAAHPGVEIDLSAVTFEPDSGSTPEAFRAGGPPDLGDLFGDFESIQLAESGILADITDDVAAELDLIGPAASSWQARGRTYGLPYSLYIEGFLYNKELFRLAGIESPPSTLAEFNAVVSRLKAAGIVPIALSAGAPWPASQYWDNFVLRECPTTKLRRAIDDNIFDPCFVRAGERLTELLATDPFNDGFTKASRSDTIELLAGGQAAMELTWPDQLVSMDAIEPVGDRFGWFPFPSTGGAGDPEAQIGAGYGFACAAHAPPECVELLKYIISSDVQSALGAAFPRVQPVRRGSRVDVGDPLATMRAVRDSATYIARPMASAWPEQDGRTLAESVLALFAGQATPRDVVAALTS